MINGANMKTQQDSETKKRALMAIKEIGTQSVSKLAAKYGISRGIIYHHARAMGIKSCASKNHRWTREELNILSEYAPTRSVAEVARMLNRPKHSIWCKASDLGVRFQKRGEKHHCAKFTDEDAHYVKLLLDAGGMTQQEIADMVEVSASFVKKIAAGRRNEFKENQ